MIVTNVNVAKVLQFRATISAFPKGVYPVVSTIRYLDIGMRAEVLEYKS